MGAEKPKKLCSDNGYFFSGILEMLSIPGYAKIRLDARNFGLGCEALRDLAKTKYPRCDPVPVKHQCSGGLMERTINTWINAQLQLPGPGLVLAGATSGRIFRRS